MLRRSFVKRKRWRLPGLDVAKGEGGGKYGAIKAACGTCGEMCDSKLEAWVCGQLHLMERGGLIKDLKSKVDFVFEHNGERLMLYEADWTWMEGGKLVVADAKGSSVLTDVFKIKRRAMRIWYGLEITILRRSKDGRLLFTRE